MLRYGGLAFYQYELGMLSPERLESALGIFNDSVCEPLFKESWARFRPNFVGSYQAYVDEKFATATC